MLSYAWGSAKGLRDNQQRVLGVKGGMTRAGVNVWMDIRGGMETDIYDSMAQVQSLFFSLSTFNTILLMNYDTGSGRCRMCDRFHVQGLSGFAQLPGQSTLIGPFLGWLSSESCYFCLFVCLFVCFF